MELFLRQEKENQFLSSKYASDQKTFSRLLDSMLLEKKELWIGMDSLNTLSPIAQKVTQAAYIYPYATIRERYALLRGTKWTAEQDSLYFGFRQYLNYSDNDLAFFDPYVNYVLNYINQETDHALDTGRDHELVTGVLHVAIGAAMIVRLAVLVIAHRTVNFRYRFGGHQLLQEQYIL